MTPLERKEARRKRVRERSDFELREQREARERFVKSRKKPVIVKQKDDRDPDKLRSMFWVD